MQQFLREETKFQALKLVLREFDTAQQQTRIRLAGKKVERKVENLKFAREFPVDQMKYNPRACIAKLEFHEVRVLKILNNFGLGLWTPEQTLASVIELYEQEKRKAEGRLREVLGVRVLLVTCGRFN